MSLAANTLSGLFQSLFGDGELLYLENGRWTFKEILGVPKLQNEGIFDYVFRILESGDVLLNKGIWTGVQYQKGNLVSHGGKYWVATGPSLASEPSSVNHDWSELLSTLTGLQGDKGDDGDTAYTFIP